MNINIDKKYYLYNKVLKILINIISYYIFLLILFSFEMTQNTQILFIITFGAVGIGSISLNNTCACDIFQSWFNKYATNRSKSLSKNVL